MPAKRVCQLHCVCEAEETEVSGMEQMEEPIEWVS